MDDVELRARVMCLRKGLDPMAESDMMGWTLERGGHFLVNWEAETFNVLAWDALQKRMAEASNE